MNNDVEDLVVTVLLILSRMECNGRVRIGHEGNKYVADVVMVEDNGELAGSVEQGSGRTLAHALRSLLWAMQRASSTAQTN